jgi:hypothetical protein
MFLKNQILIFFLSLTLSTLAFAETHKFKSEFTDEILEVSVLNPEELEKIFNYISNNSLIPFDTPVDGCAARAYLMITAAKLKSIHMAKIVADVTNRSKAKIEISNFDVPWIYRWDYHIAPFVFLKETPTSKIKPMVIDPSLFNRPVSKEEFIFYMSQNPSGLEPKVELDVFYLPPYVTTKDQLSKDVKLDKLDRAMMVQLQQVSESVEVYGKYLEKKPLLDSDQNKCYQGGLEIPLNKCTESSN